jgi:hypothetical protein
MLFVCLWIISTLAARARLLSQLKMPTTTCPASTIRARMTASLIHCSLNARGYSLLRLGRLLLAENAQGHREVCKRARGLTGG